MEFNPIDKVPELTEMLKEYNPIIHSKSDEKYDWLDEDSLCIELPNQGTGDGLTIECGSYGEFTVSFSYYHSHYSANDFEYGCMCERLAYLLNNKYCAAAMFCGSENKWMGSTMVEKEKILLPLEEIFDFVFERNEFAEKLRTNGGEARFIFWDSSLNKIVKY